MHNHGANKMLGNAVLSALPMSSWAPSGDQQSERIGAE